MGFPNLDLSEISFVCPIAWFGLAGLIRLGGVPDLPEQDQSILLGQIMRTFPAWSILIRQIRHPITAWSGKSAQLSSAQLRQIRRSGKQRKFVRRLVLRVLKTLLVLHFLLILQALHVSTSSSAGSIITEDTPTSGTASSGNAVTIGTTSTADI